MKARANWTVIGAMSTGAALLLPANPVTQIVGVTGLVLLAGVVAGARLSIDAIPPAHRIALVAGYGIVGLLLAGALIGALLPILGVGLALHRDPLLVVALVALVALASFAGVRDWDPLQRASDGLHPRQLGWMAALSVPPIVALWGAVRLNSGGTPWVAIAVALTVVAMVLLAIVLPSHVSGPPRVLLLGSALVTGALQGPLRGGWLAGVDIQHEYYVATLALRQAQFPLTHYSDPYGGMLSLTVLPAGLHGLLGVDMRTTFALLPSLFLGLCLLCVWCAMRDRVSPRWAAVLCGLFVVGAEPLMRELPQITRQCDALFFFALLVLSVSSRAIPTRVSRITAVIAGVGMAVTHYSTAYLAAAAVICGFLLASGARDDRRIRVLTLPVTTAVVGIAVVWGGLVARTGSSIGQVISSIRHDGLNLLPAGGSLISRWISGASISQLVNARVIRRDDLALLSHQYHWMSIPASAFGVPLVNDPAPTAGGLPVLGSILSVVSSTVAQLTLLVAVVGVVMCVIAIRRRREFAGLAGIAIFFVVFATVSRLSQTVGVDFDPSRVQAQSFLLFAVVVSVAMAEARTVRLRAWISANRWMALATGTALAAVAVCTSTELVNLAIERATLPAELAVQGEQSARLLTPTDLLAARWLASNQSVNGFVQADRFGQLGLDVYGYNDRRLFIPSADPVLVNSPSWLLAYHTNVVDGSARGGNNAHVGVFRFPLTYYAQTRSVLYVSNEALVFGPTPK